MFDTICKGLSVKASGKNMNFVESEEVWKTAIPQGMLLFKSLILC